uniref:Reverse transcriptase/retrotransposon-derived protein RNase H-like domain-containing protein n=1 Tax=Physcomitrium patens TaxID=3218 RepID=A0A2K1L6Q5_PHYPA|nr:hypothetical protein PHYPA_000117 [Physcomitrium patens]
MKKLLDFEVSACNLRVNFLRLVHYYQRFIKNFSNIVNLLTIFIYRDLSWTWKCEK